MRMGFLWLVVSHSAACIRILFAAVEGYSAAGDVDNWNLPVSLAERGPLTQYLHSLHWCMGLMTGMADGSLPAATGQFYFTVGAMTSGAFIFAFSVGAIGAMGENRMKKAEELQLNINAMKRFLARYPDLPIDLVRSITDYYHYNMKQETIGALSTSAHVLDDLPLALRCEAVQCLTRKALDQVPLFATAEEGFMIALTQKMEMAVACPNEVMMSKGIAAKHMYVVLRGRLEVLNDGGAVKTEYVAGSCFGEQSLLTGATSDVWVVASAYCVLYQLHTDDFKKLQKEFVKTFEGFAQAAKLQAKALKKDLMKGGKGSKGHKPSQVSNADKAPEDTSSPSGDKVRGMADVDDEPSAHMMLRDDIHFAGRAAAGGHKSMPGKAPEEGAARFIVLPKSTTRAAWSFLLLVALTYEMIAFPVKLTFVGDRLVAGFVVLDAIADLVLLCDVWLRFRLAILEDGQLIRTGLSKRYRRLRFWPNLLGSLPLSPLLLAWPAADARWLQAARVSRLLRLLWWVRASDHDVLTERQQPTNLEELLRVFRTSQFDIQFASANLLPLLFIYGCLAHYVACAYWGIVLSEVPQNDATSWLPDPAPLPLRTNETLSEWMPTEQLLKGGDVEQWYYRALYFSVSTLTGLGKDFNPASDLSSAFTIIVFIVGVLVFAYITSSIVAVVNQADVAVRDFQRRKIGLLGYMQDAGIDEDVVLRASHWLDTWWTAHGAMRIEKVLESLTPALRHRLQTNIFGAVTDKVPLFMTNCDGAPPLPYACLEALADAIVFEVYNQGEWVLHKGMLAESLYVICIGSAQVLLDEKDGVIISVLRKGDAFGEHSAIQGAKCTASVRAKEPLELMSIHREMLLKCIDKYDAFKTRLHLLETQRQQENTLFVKWNSRLKEVREHGDASFDDADQVKQIKLSRPVGAGGDLGWQALRAVADVQTVKSKSSKGMSAWDEALAVDKLQKLGKMRQEQRNSPPSIPLGSDSDCASASATEGGAKLDACLSIDLPPPAASQAVPPATSNVSSGGEPKDEAKLDSKRSRAPWFSDALKA